MYYSHAYAYSRIPSTSCQSLYRLHSYLDNAARQPLAYVIVASPCLWCSHLTYLCHVCSLVSAASLLYPPPLNPLPRSLTPHHGATTCYTQACLLICVAPIIRTRYSAPAPSVDMLESEKPHPNININILARLLVDKTLSSLLPMLISTYWI